MGLASWLRSRLLPSAVMRAGILRLHNFFGFAKGIDPLRMTGLSGGVTRGSVSVQFARALPGVENSVDDGDGGEDRDHPEHRGHDVEQSADNQEHQALRTFHEADSAGTD